jgi:mRNA interferase MazF
MEIKRMEIWKVDFNPTLGAEIKKKRPALVVSSDAVGILPIKLIAPITDWKPYFKSNLWHISISPTTQNGLDKESVIDVLQLRGVDTQRFIEKIGEVDAVTMRKVVEAISLVIEY